MKKTGVVPAILLAVLGAPSAVMPARTSTAIKRFDSLRNVYYGDLHLHTSYSFDAYFTGAQVDPDGAYRFARGEPGRYLNEEVKRSSLPLDFAAVTDHAELMGFLNALDDPASELSRSEMGQKLRQRRPEAFRKLGRWPVEVDPPPDVDVKAILQSAWRRTIAAANRHYEAGRFTTFIAYEWTASSGGALHRNVIFRGSQAPDPFTSFDSARPEDLWAYLERIRKRGYEALAIPHNSNLSNGLMFDWLGSDGKTIDREYSQRRSFNEPLVEIVQNKGQSETHPVLSPNDEFSDFEVFDRYLATPIVRKPGSYVRDGLDRGLKIAQRTGVNPFKYGFVGGSDFHNGLSDSAENAYAGTFGAVDPKGQPPNLDRWMEYAAEIKPGVAERAAQVRGLYWAGSAGLTGVWAEQNTRESIYAALRRRETFATSGTRLRLRFFGGWSYRRDLFKSKSWLRTAYAGGVAMGGELPRTPAGKKAPLFAVWAVKDPNGANLDRLQMVKVWLQDGKPMESVHDVALSDGRGIDPKTGRAPPVANTVNLREATYTNATGSAELHALWQDSQFDPQVPTLYYIRVLETPTPRWSTIVAVKQGRELPEGVPATIQERGWSSPIWYVDSAFSKINGTKVR